MNFEKYFDFLKELTAELKNLTELQKSKLKAIEEHSLDALNDCIKKEQAISLKMRGIEQKRVKLLNELGLSGTKMADISQKCPAQHKENVEKQVEATMSAYDEYKSIQTKATAEIARNMKFVETSLAHRGYVLENDEQDVPTPTHKTQPTDFKV